MFLSLSVGLRVQVHAAWHLRLNEELDLDFRDIRLNFLFFFSPHCLTTVNISRCKAFWKSRDFVSPKTVFAVLL